MPTKLKNKLNSLENNRDCILNQIDELLKELGDYEEDIEEIEEKIDKYGDFNLRAELYIYSFTKLKYLEEEIREYFKENEVEDCYAIDLAKQLNVFEDFQQNKFN